MTCQSWLSLERPKLEAVSLPDFVSLLRAFIIDCTCYALLLTGAHPAVFLESMDFPSSVSPLKEKHSRWFLGGTSSCRTLGLWTPGLLLPRGCLSQTLTHQPPRPRLFSGREARSRDHGCKPSSSDSEGCCAQGAASVPVGPDIFQME